MRHWALLWAALTYFASEYLWENGERFLSNRDLRIRALQKRQKEEEAENLELHDLAQLRVRNLRG